MEYTFLAWCHLNGPVDFHKTKQKLKILIHKCKKILSCIYNAFIPNKNLYIYKYHRNKITNYNNIQN